MGIGFALKEEFQPGVTRGFAEYQIPTTHDVPEIKTIFIERRNAGGPVGSKGLGECALIPTAPAILNAANEVAVAAFLDEKLPFLGIPSVIEHALEQISAVPVTCLEDVQQADSLARAVASEHILRQGAGASAPHPSLLTPH
jgi:hypothetical protein